MKRHEKKRKSQKMRKLSLAEWEEFRRAAREVGQSAERFARTAESLRSVGRGARMSIPEPARRHSEESVDPVEKELGEAD